MDDLAKLRAKRDTLTVELNKVNADIVQLEQNINGYLNPTMVTPPTPAPTHPKTTISAPHQHTQPLATAQQVTQGLHTQKATTTPKPATVANLEGTKCAPQSATTTTSVAPTTPSPSLDMQSVIQSRAPYHTEALQIVGVVPTGTITMHQHYLYGDGISSGIASPEGYTVKLVTSGAGKEYRLMEAPAMKITCTLAAPLPTDIKAKKAAIKQWLVANEWLSHEDPTKAQFYTEYDAWGEPYSPYISVDSKGNNLFIYIGCTSLQDATPFPHFVA